MVIFLEKLDGDVEHEQVRRIRDMLPVFHDMLKAADAIDMFTRDVLAT